jgi:prepilin-type N-terminal cleavage/methylation domain-containing protein
MRSPLRQTWIASHAFTMLEIMIVVSITGIIIAIVTPTWMNQRGQAQQRVCQENLAKIDGVKQQWALELNQPTSAQPTWDDLVHAGGGGFLKTQPVCPAGGTYTINPIDKDATCTINHPRDHNAKQ